jgi:SOS-response transcriptional repressor LexA
VKARAKLPELLTSESLDADHRAIIDFIVKYRQTHEYSPRIDEIAEGVGQVFGTVRQRIERLIKSGWLIKPDNVYRAIRPSRPEERSGSLERAWLEKLRALPLEERHAACRAAVKIDREMLAAAGEERAS